MCFNVKEKHPVLYQIKRFKQNTKKKKINILYERVSASQKKKTKKKRAKIDSYF